MANLTYDLSTALKAHLDRRTTVRHALAHAPHHDPTTNVATYMMGVLMSVVFPDPSIAHMTSGSSVIGEIKRKPTSRDIKIALNYLGKESRILNGQPLTYVNSEICDLLNIATAKMGEDVLHESDLIAPEGFIYLARPIVQRDFHPAKGTYDDRAQHAIRAIGWHQEEIGLSMEGKDLGRGVILTIYSDTGITRNIVTPSLKQIAIEDGLNPDDYEMNYLPDADHSLYPTDVLAWAFAQNWCENPDLIAMNYNDREDVTVVPTTISDIRKWFIAFMRFCWQELLVPRQPTNSDVSRQQRRAFERESKVDNPISVVYLRRLREEANEPVTLGHSLTYRVLVRGHWRNQYYPTLGPVGDPMSHRRIWIDPHVKGPEHAPFRDLPKVTAVVR